MLNRGMWMVTWLQREILQGVDLEVLEREAQNVPLGAEGITVIPRWGAPVATPHERGAILGFSEAHGRGHLYRAVIEGICMDLRRGLELLERESGRRLDDLRVGGGGARSDWVVQTLASVLNRPLRRGRTQELSALGAAVNAAVHAGWYPDHAAAAAAMTEGGQTTEPVPEDAALYRSLYKEHFLPRLRAAGRAHRP